MRSHSWSRLTDASGRPVSLPSFLNDFLVFRASLSLFLGPLALAAPPCERLELLYQTPNCSSKPVGTRGTICPALPY